MPLAMASPSPAPPPLKPVLPEGGVQRDFSRLVKLLEDQVMNRVINPNAAVADNHFDTGSCLVDKTAVCLNLSPVKRIFNGILNWTFDKWLNISKLAN
jgi:hypothetical protein